MPDVVHQADGKVSEQLNIPIHDAYQRLQTYADDQAESLISVSRNVVNGGLRFDRTNSENST